jgi:hypothetical protein
MYNNSKIKAFAEVDSYEEKAQFEGKIIKHIERESKEYILSIDENDYIEYLINEFSLEPLVI